jgi:rfaE bifunctional protein kinase chain/domain
LGQLEGDRLKELVDEFASKNVVVLGDSMLDHYVYTEARKLSREAPVIVSDYISEEFSPGGAANLATLLKRLGANVSIVGVIGKDDEGETLLNELRAEGVDTSGLIEVEGRPTCVKTRIYVGRRQQLRIDREDRKAVDLSVTSKLINNLRGKIEQHDIAVLSDHDKGTLTTTLISEVVKLSRSLNKCIVGRPKVDHLLDFAYMNSLLSTVREASEAVGTRVLNDTSIRNIGFNILTRLEPNSFYLWDRNTSFLFEPGHVSYFPASNEHTNHERIGLRDIITAAYSLTIASSAPALDAALIARAAEGVSNSSISNRGEMSRERLKAAIDHLAKHGYAYTSVGVK